VQADVAALDTLDKGIVGDAAAVVLDHQPSRPAVQAEP
jgi:hypothetical protein